MKKLLIVGMLLMLAGCNIQSKYEETENTEKKETSIPEIVESTSPRNGSKINIDLYPTETYYPIVEGVVTYPNGKRDEFMNGVSVINMDGEEEYWLYESYFPDELIEFDLKKSNLIDAGERSDDFYLKERQFKVLNTGFPVYVSRNLPQKYFFAQDSLRMTEIIDGVLGIEYVNGTGELVTFVAYRYSNYLPTGFEINESFRIIRDEVTFYVWRLKEFTEVEKYIEQNQNFPAEMWISMNRGESLCTVCATFK